MDTRRRLQNPYVVGNALSDPGGYGFYGRRNIYQFICERLDAVRRPAILLFGHRRIGKTSILRQMPRYLPSDFRVVFFDMQGQHDDPFPDILRGLAYEIAAATKLTWENLDALEPDEFKTKFLPQVYAQLGGDKHRLVILVDEFDTLDVQQPEAKRFISFLQRWMNEEQEVGYVFVIGRQPETISKLFQKLSTITYSIGRLDQSETEAVIRSPARGVLEYPDEVVDKIWGFTAGHPLATQLICFELWSRWSQTGVVPPKGVDAALPAALAAGSNQLNQIYDDLEQSSYRLFLSALAETAGDNGSADMATISSALKRYQVDLTPSLAEIRQTLLARDIIAELDGSFRYTVELIRLWVVRNRPLGRLKDDAALVNEEAYRAYRVAEDFRQSALREADDNERLRLLNQAAGNYQLALGRNPMLVAARIGLLQALTEQRSYENATIEAERVYLVDRSYRTLYRDTLVRWAEVFENTREYAKALQVYERIVDMSDFQHDEELQRRYSSAAVVYGEELLRSGRYDEALARFIKAGTTQAIAKAQVAKGESLLHSGQFEDALEWFAQAGAHDAIARAQADKRKAWEKLKAEINACREEDDWEGCLQLVVKFRQQYSSDQEAEILAQNLRDEAGVDWINRADALLAAGDGRQALHYMNKVKKVGLPENATMVQQAQQAAAAQEQLAQIAKAIEETQSWEEAAIALDKMDRKYVGVDSMYFKLQQRWRSAILVLPAPTDESAAKVAAGVQQYMDRYPDDAEVQVMLNAVNAQLRKKTLREVPKMLREREYDLSIQKLATVKAIEEFPRLLINHFLAQWGRTWLWRLPLWGVLAYTVLWLLPGLTAADFVRIWVLSLCTYLLISSLVNNAIVLPFLFRKWRRLALQDAAWARKLPSHFRKKGQLWLMWGDVIGMTLALVLAALLALPSSLFLPQSISFWCSIVLSAILGGLAGMWPHGSELIATDDTMFMGGLLLSVGFIWVIVVPVGYGLPILIFQWLNAGYFIAQFVGLLMGILLAGFVAIGTFLDLKEAAKANL